MSELKITVEQLKNYLETNLIIETSYTRYIGNNTVVSTRELSGQVMEMFMGKYYNYLKPHCYRLSDLDKEIEVNGERFVPVIELAKLITQAGFDYKKIESISNENDTITCEFKQINHPDLPLTSHKYFFDIDIDKDFGFTIGAVIEHLGVTTEEYECTGNIWEMYQKLFEWHFWPFGDEYFEHGLVIDKMKTK